MRTHRKTSDRLRFFGSWITQHTVPPGLQEHTKQKEHRELSRGLQCWWGSGSTNDACASLHMCRWVQLWVLRPNADVLIGTTRWLWVRAGGLFTRVPPCIDAPDELERCWVGGGCALELFGLLVGLHESLQSCELLRVLPQVDRKNAVQSNLPVDFRLGVGVGLAD